MSLTLTQTIALPFDGQAKGDSTAYAFDTWIYSPFQTPGTLTSVQFDARVEASVQIDNFNPTKSAEPWTPRISIKTQIRFFPNDLSSAPLIDSFESKTTLLKPGKSGTCTANFSQTYSHLFVSREDLAIFAGKNGLGRIAVESEYRGGGNHGGIHGTETATMTLTYTYDLIPDMTASLAMLALSVGAALLSRRFLAGGIPVAA